jgi:Tripartite tricarboxylate transporter TctB family
MTLNFRLGLAALVLGAVGVLAVEATSISGLAGTYPQLLVAAVIALTLVVAIEEARSTRLLADIDAELAGLWPDQPQVRLHLLVFVAAWLAYPALLSAAGFVGATSLVLAISLFASGLRRLGLNLGLAIGFSIALAVLLKTVLYVPMPLGPADLALERLLYSLRN